jgi:hypothetical protein
LDGGDRIKIFNPVAAALVFITASGHLVQPSQLTMVPNGISCMLLHVAGSDRKISDMFAPGPALKYPSTSLLQNQILPKPPEGQHRSGHGAKDLFSGCADGNCAGWLPLAGLIVRANKRQ